MSLMANRLMLGGVLAGLFSLTVQSAGAQSVGAQVSELLRAGHVRAELLELTQPPRLALLMRKVEQAAQRDPTWFQNHVRNAEPGKPLPYDPKLGVTETEYAELLVLRDSMRMKPVGTVDLVVERSRVGWRFGNGTTLAGLRGIEIDTLRNQVHSPFGDLATTAPITPNENQQATGPWGGPRWNIEVVDQATVTGTVAQFAVGKHQETGRTVIFYEARKVANGQVQAQESMFLLILR